MDTKTLVSKIKKAFRIDCGEGMEEYGHKIRFVTDGVVELGHSYFYQSQAKIDVDMFVTYAADAGAEIELTPVGTMSFQQKAWPKTSWATQNYNVVIK